MSRLGALRSAYGLFRTESRADTVTAVVIAAAAAGPFVLEMVRERGGER